MKKLILCLLALTSLALSSNAQCGYNLTFTSTTKISSDSTINTAAASNTAMQDILICAGNKLTYNYASNYKQFFVEGGATLVLNELQVGNVYLASGATLIIDTVPGNMQMVDLQVVYFDSTNVTLTDTNQLLGNPVYQHCTGAVFNYLGWPPNDLCTPLAVSDNRLKTLLNISFKNPVQDQIKLNELLLENIATVRLIDISGKTLKAVSDAQQPIDVSYLPEGIYLLEVGDKEGRRAVRKFYKD